MVPLGNRQNPAPVRVGQMAFDEGSGSIVPGLPVRRGPARGSRRRLEQQPEQASVGQPQQEHHG